MKVFTARSTGIGIAIAVLVAVTFGRLIGASWGLAVLNGLAIGALAILVSCGVRLGRFRLKPRDPATLWRWRPAQGVWMLGWSVLSAPSLLAYHFSQLDPASEAALAALFFATGSGAYFCGEILATLEHLDRPAGGSTGSERPYSAGGGTGAEREQVRGGGQASP